MISLVPVVTRVRERFLINQVCVIADRGMISSATVATLDLQVKEVIRKAKGADGRPRKHRDIVCSNEAEVKNDAALSLQARGN